MPDQQKSTSIYDLLTPGEKTVYVKLGDKEIPVLLKKLDSQRNDEYSLLLGEAMETSMDKAREEHGAKIAATVLKISKKELIDGILRFEGRERELKLDLIEIENEDVLDDKEKAVEEKKNLDKWEKRRAAEYKGLSIPDLRRKFQGLCILRMGEMHCMEELKYVILYCKCFDPDNPEQRFFSLKKEAKNNKAIPFHPKSLIPGFIDKLLRVLGEFDPAVNEKDTRRLAAGPDFLASTTSQDTSEDP